MRRLHRSKQIKERLGKQAEAEQAEQGTGVCDVCGKEFADSDLIVMGEQSICQGCIDEQQDD